MKGLIPADELRGTSEYETEVLRSYLQDARAFLQGFAWCKEIREQLFGLGLGGVIAVFLMEVRIEDVGYERLWVVAGNPPPAYFAQGRAATACEALIEYCKLADDWATCVRRGTPLSRTALGAEPTESVADEVASKVFTLRLLILPALCPGYSPTQHAPASMSPTQQAETNSAPRQGELSRFFRRKRCWKR